MQLSFASTLFWLLPLASSVAVPSQSLPRDATAWSISDIVYLSSPDSAPAFNGYTHTLTFNFTDINQPPAKRIQTCSAIYSPGAPGDNPDVSVKCGPDPMYSFGASKDISNGPAGTLITIWLFHHYSFPNISPGSACRNVSVQSVNALLDECENNKNGIGVCKHAASLPGDNYKEYPAASPNWKC